MNSTGLPNVMQIFFLFLSCYLFRALVLPNLSRALTMDEFFEIVTFYFLLFIPVKLFITLFKTRNPGNAQQNVFPRFSCVSVTFI